MLTRSRLVRTTVCRARDAWRTCFTKARRRRARNFGHTTPTRKCVSSQDHVVSAPFVCPAMLSRASGVSDVAHSCSLHCAWACGARRNGCERRSCSSDPTVCRCLSCDPPLDFSTWSFFCSTCWEVPGLRGTSLVFFPSHCVPLVLWSLLCPRQALNEDTKTGFRRSRAVAGRLRRTFLPVDAAVVWALEVQRVG